MSLSLLISAAALLSYVVSVEGKALRANSGKCGSLQDCYLRNLDTQEEFKLEREDTLSYHVQQGARFSMRCETEGDIQKIIQNHPIAHDQQEYIARVSPWWTNAGEGDWINPVRHLSNCGPKPIQVFGYVGDDECFAEEFLIEATCEEELCTFQCPDFSEPREDHICLSSFDNCQCDFTYRLVSDFCVKKWCYHDFQCPEGKDRILGRDCYTGPRDCKFAPRSALSQ